MLQGDKFGTKLVEVHFLVKEGIVFGNKVSQKGLEVYLEMIELIEKFPSPDL